MCLGKCLLGSALELLRTDLTYAVVHWGYIDLSESTEEQQKAEWRCLSPRLTPCPVPSTYTSQTVMNACTPLSPPHCLMLLT